MRSMQRVPCFWLSHVLPIGRDGGSTPARSSCTLPMEVSTWIPSPWASKSGRWRPVASADCWVSSPPWSAWRPLAHVEDDRTWLEPTASRRVLTLTMMHNCIHPHGLDYASILAELPADLFLPQVADAVIEAVFPWLISHPLSLAPYLEWGNS